MRSWNNYRAIGNWLIPRFPRSCGSCNKKNILGIKKVSRQHIYYPRLNKETYATHSIKKIVQQVFSGKSSELVAYLVDKNKLSLDEINALQQLLDAKKNGLS